MKEENEKTTEIVVKIKDLMVLVQSSVNASLDHILEMDDLANIKDMLTYQHQTGGKRLRPLLTVLVGLTLGADYEEIVKLSTLCELLHDASLLLDDVVDWDRERRGEPTTMDLFSAGSALMGGITKTAEAVNQALGYGIPMARLIVNSMRDLSIGNSEELIRYKPLDEDQYFRVIGLKTASLFKAAGELGSIVAKQDDKIVKEAAAFGDALGTMYQLCDDIVDVEKSIRLNKPIGDMKLGIMTLPIITAYRYTDDTEIKRLIWKFIDQSIEKKNNKRNSPLLEKYRSHLESQTDESKENHEIIMKFLADTHVAWVKEGEVDRKKQITSTEIKKILKEVQKQECVQYVRNEIEDIMDRAKMIVQDWPDNSYKEMLLAMPEFMANAILKEIDSPDER